MNVQDVMLRKPEVMIVIEYKKRNIIIIAIILLLIVIMAVRLAVFVAQRKNNNSNDSDGQVSTADDMISDKNFEIGDGKLTVTPESYNGTVEANNTVGCGVQLIFSDQEAAGKVSKTGELYLAGEKVDTSKLDGSDASSDDGSSSSTKKDLSDKESAKKETGTPFANHGALSVKETDLVDESGSKYQLKGVSTHGLAWFPDYVNEESFKTFRDDWGANVIRLAMYTDENGGYCTDGNKDSLKKLVKSGIDEATNLGMYVIVDWHILHDLTPLKYKEIERAKEYRNDYLLRKKVKDDGTEV